MGQDGFSGEPKITSPQRRSFFQKVVVLSSRLRIALASIVVALAAFGGAALVTNSQPSADGHLTLAMADPTIGGDPSRRMLDQTVERIEDTYYKPVEIETLVQGERRGLVALLHAHHITDPNIPRLVPTGDHSRDLALLDDEVSRTAARYHASATRDELTQAAISGMLGSLNDPYTTYLSKHEIDMLQEELKGGDFGGIGVFIVQDPKTKSIIVDPIEGNPAIRAGMRRDDIIVSVNGHATQGMKIDDVERMIRGPVGTIVALGVRHHGNHLERTIRVTRSDVHVPSVVANIKDGIEDIRLADFGSSSADEVRAALQKGKSHHVRGYILDLRNNGGGLLDAAVDVSSLFISNGTIVSTIDRAGHRDVRTATGGIVAGARPLVILVNQYTASASEITAGAVQDDRVGTLVGTKTFGKGVVQSLYYISDGSALKITTARYVTPAGRDIQHRGIVPDVVVNQPVDLPIIDTKNDRQLAAAERIISKKDKE